MSSIHQQGMESVHCKETREMKMSRNWISFIPSFVQNMRSKTVRKISVPVAMEVY